MLLRPQTKDNLTKASDKQRRQIQLLEQTNRVWVQFVSMKLKSLAVSKNSPTFAVVILNNAILTT